MFHSPHYYLTNYFEKKKFIQTASGRLENNIVQKEKISAPVNFKQIKHTKIDPSSPIGFEDIPLEWQEELQEGRLTPQEYENMLKSYKKYVARRKLSKRAEKIKNLKEAVYIEKQKGSLVEDDESLRKLSSVDEALQTLFTTSVYHSQKKIQENVEYPTLESYKQGDDDDDDEEGEEEEEEEEEDEFY